MYDASHSKTTSMSPIEGNVDFMNYTYDSYLFLACRVYKRIDPATTTL